MRFLGSNFTQNALADPTGEAKSLPRTLCRFQGPLRGRGKGKEGKEGGGKGVLGRERGREGKGRGEEGKGEGGGKGRGRVCVFGVRGTDAPADPCAHPDFRPSYATARRSAVGDRVFAVAGPRARNGLPVFVTDCT